MQAESELESQKRTRNTSWSCVDLDESGKRIITTGKIRAEPFMTQQTTIDTGSRVLTESSQAGVLVCTSDMGITPLGKSFTVKHYE